METIMFGMLSLTSAMLAVMFIGRKPLLSCIGGIITVVFISLSAYNWWLALGDSGKNQQWLGFGQYPAAIIICIILATFGLVCAIVGAVRFVMKTNKGKRHRNALQ